MDKHNAAGGGDDLGVRRGGLRNTNGRLSIKKALGTFGILLVFALAILLAFRVEVSPLIIEAMVVVAVVSLLLLGIKSAVNLLHLLVTTRSGRLASQVAMNMTDTETTVAPPVDTPSGEGGVGL